MELQWLRNRYCDYFVEVSVRSVSPDQMEKNIRRSIRLAMRPASTRILGSYDEIEIEALIKDIRKRAHAYRVRK